MTDLPRGAEAIESARRERGLMPDGPVVVSLVGRLPYWPEAAVVTADPARSYRWDWIRGLEAHVWVKPGINAGPTLMAILKAFPRFTWKHYATSEKPADGLMLWDTEKRAGAYLELAWPDAFHAALDALAMANRWDDFQRVISRRYEHPRLAIRSTPMDEHLNRDYARSLAWMEGKAWN